MSPSSLLDAVTSSTQLSEAAISSAQDSVVATTLSAIHINAALAAAKLAVELGTNMEMKNTPTIASSDVSVVTTSEENKVIAKNISERSFRNSSTTTSEGSMVDVSTMTTSGKSMADASTMTNFRDKMVDT